MDLFGGLWRPLLRHHRSLTVRRRLSSFAAVIVGLFFAARALAAADDTDVVTLYNGDHLTGEVKSLDRGKLRFKTDDLGTVEIEWVKVATVTAKERFEVELSNGERYFGTLAPSPTNGKVTVATNGGTETIDLVSIVRMAQVEATFVDRLSGGVTVGFDFATATDLTQWSASANATYRVENYTGRLNLSSILRSQASIDTTTRNSLGLQVNRTLPARWFFTWLANAEQNDELGLDFRSLLGAGGGRHFLQTNRTRLDLLGAVGYSREQFQDEDAPRNSAEALAGATFDFFIFDDPEVDIRTQAYLVPSLTEGGRVRVEIKTDLRIEIFSDFFLGLNLVESYDSQPGEFASKNDFAIFTSVGWTF